MRKLKKYKPTAFKAKDSVYDKDAADYAVNFIECLCHTKGTWAGRPFELIDWQEQIIRDLFGILKPNGYRQFNTAYVEIPKKMGKSELAAAIALLLTCGDGEERAEVYGCAADRQQATIVFDVAADMVRMCPALNKRVKILASQKRIIFQPTNSFYQVLSAEAYSKHGFNIHGVVFDELHTLTSLPFCPWRSAHRTDRCTRAVCCSASDRLLRNSNSVTPFPSRRAASRQSSLYSISRRTRTEQLSWSANERTSLGTKPTFCRSTNGMVTRPRVPMMR